MAGSREEIFENGHVKIKKLNLGAGEEKTSDILKKKYLNNIDENFGEWYDENTDIDFSKNKSRL